VRAILKVKSSIPADSALSLQQFKCDMFRDFYIRLSKTGANQITARAYQYEGNAVAGDDTFLASGTGAMGDRVAITLTSIASPPFDFGGMQALVTSANVPVYSVYAHTGAPAARVLKQMIDVLGSYRATGEVLERVVNILPGSRFEEPVFPGIGIEMLEGFNVGMRGSFHVVLQATIWIFDELTIGGYQDVLELGEQVMAIAVDEQRTWGGMVNDTKARGVVSPAPAFDLEDKTNEQYMWVVQVPLSIDLPDILASQGPNYPEYKGGRYGVDYR
jgi:hypothetical protein